MNRTRNRLQSLLESRSGIHLTAYLVNRGNAENLVSQLHEIISRAYECLAPVLDREKRNRFLEPLDALIANPNRLSKMTGNIGIFRTINSVQIVNVPVAVTTACHIATSFHVKPLLRWRQEDPNFWLLGISHEAAKLYTGDQNSFKEFDSFHFSNGQRDLENLSDWLVEFLGKNEQHSIAKLFLAGPSEHTGSLQRRAVRAGIQTTVTGFPFREKVSAEICTWIRGFIKADSSVQADGFLSAFNSESNQNRVQKNVFQISRAAVEGRVSKLVVCDDIAIFGNIDLRSGGLSLNPFDLDHEDDDILDDLAQIVLSRGGEVLVAPREKIPNARPVLALLNEDRPPLRKAVLRAQYEALEERFG